jgi:hypothetical protein
LPLQTPSLYALLCLIRKWIRSSRLLALSAPNTSDHDIYLISLPQISA